ncbi:MAG: sulfide/dihydroorotate dehydrogenase-like FAD/NAD-binding protein [Clostridia bacterium]|nr:sulfide/dihydroorotate dehydrogenase-like FAD/NAD-binding protein [Clostridia bacterium]
MFKIVKKTKFSDTVTQMTLDAPLIAKKTEPGQFVIIRVEQNNSERIPLTISNFNREKGTITLVFQTVGATTLKLSCKEEGDFIADCVGPLGKPTDLENVKTAAVIGGGVGCAIALPVAKKLKENGADVDIIIGFRNKDLIILEDEFRKTSTTYLMTDDGSKGEKGLVTNALENLILSGKKYDCVYVFGPLIMMKFVALVGKKYNVKTLVSMNPIMIDGTGMCGGCRLTVGGETKFACVDGPEFDGSLVDFDEALARTRIYKEMEKHAFDDACNLLKGNK